MAETMRPQPEVRPRPGGGIRAQLDRVPRPVLIIGGVVFVVGSLVLYRRYKANKTIAEPGAGTGRFGDAAYQYAPGTSGGGGGGIGSALPPVSAGGGTTVPETAPLQEVINNLQQQLDEALRPTPASIAGSRLIESAATTRGIFSQYGDLVLNTPERQTSVATQVALGRDPQSVVTSLNEQARIAQGLRGTGAPMTPQQEQQLVSNIINNRQSEADVLRWLNAVAAGGGPR